MIGFDGDDTISPGSTFQVFGTQNWGIQDYATHVSGGTTHYVIPMGQFFTGDFTYLIFANDHDVATPTAESVFTNVHIYEQTS